MLPKCVESVINFRRWWKDAVWDVECRFDIEAGVESIIFIFIYLVRHECFYLDVAVEAWEGGVSVCIPVGVVCGVGDELQTKAEKGFEVFWGLLF